MIGIVEEKLFVDQITEELIKKIRITALCLPF